jgi:hypothetical protein
LIINGVFFFELVDSKVDSAVAITLLTDGKLTTGVVVPGSGLPFFLVGLCGGYEFFLGDIDRSLAGVWLGVAVVCGVTKSGLCGWSFFCSSAKLRLVKYVFSPK